MEHNIWAIQHALQYTIHYTNIVIIMGAHSNELNVLQYIKMNPDKYVLTLNNEYYERQLNHLCVDFNDRKSWETLILLNNKINTIIFDYSVTKFIYQSCHDTVQELHNLLVKEGKMYLYDYNISIEQSIDRMEERTLDFVEERYPELDNMIKYLLNRIKFNLNISSLYGNHNINKGGNRFYINNMKEIEKIRDMMEIKEKVGDIINMYIVPVLRNKNKIYFTNVMLSHYNFSCIEEINNYPLININNNMNSFIVIIK
jgi:hypothetical protein